MFDINFACNLFLCDQSDVLYGIWKMFFATRARGKKIINRNADTKRKKQNKNEISACNYSGYSIITRIYVTESI